jgi:hypothetical protein
MNHHNFAQRAARRALRFHQHLNARLSVYQAALHGKFRRDVRPLPEIPGDGLQMWIIEERFEYNHAANL